MSRTIAAPRIAMDATDGNLRIVVVEHNSLTWTAEITDLSTGEVVLTEKWRGECAWSDAQRWVSDATGEHVYFGGS